jgi:hypothetical protein
MRSGIKFLTLTNRQSYWVSNVRLIQKFRRHGLVTSLKIGTNLVLDLCLGKLSDKFFHRLTAVRRLVIANRLANEVDNEIQYGIFKGMKLVSLRWGGHDKAPMILGSYESEVSRAIEKSAIRATTFIDIGAADGYFAIGAVFSGLFERAICFEISEEGRDSINLNAARNNVADKVTIHAEASENSLLSLSTELNSGELFLLCDIEGGEFDLFSPRVLHGFRQSTILIEIHDFSETDCDRYLKLKSLAEPLFSLSELSQESRNPNLSMNTRVLHDDDKWLLMSEGRPKAMTWLLLSPKV